MNNFRVHDAEASHIRERERERERRKLIIRHLPKRIKPNNVITLRDMKYAREPPHEVCDSGVAMVKNRAMLVLQRPTETTKGPGCTVCWELQLLITPRGADGLLPNSLPLFYYIRHWKEDESGFSQYGKVCNYISLQFQISSSPTRDRL